MRRRKRRRQTDGSIDGIERPYRRALGQGLLVFALGHVPPLVVGIAMPTQPALSALLGWIYYGETLTGRDWVGAAMIVVALILVRLKQKGEPDLHEPVAAPN